MNIVFMGTPEFSVPILTALAERYTIVGIVTQPDKPVGRKRILSASPVKNEALSLGLTLLQPQRIRVDYDAILALNPDLIITAAYGQILPKALLERPRYGAINVHASLLPKLRGGAPVQRAIERGHKTTGITIMKMATKMDAGDIYAQKAIAIEKDETSGTLFPKLSQLGRDLLIEVLPSILSGALTATPQNEDAVTYAYNLKPEEEYLDFNQPGEQLEAKIRAFYPEPSTYTYLGEEKFKIRKAEFFNCESFFPLHGNKANGEVLKIIDNGIGIKTETGALIATEVQLQGRKAMAARDFMNGIGKAKIVPGLILKKPV